MKASIIIATYNRPGKLFKAIESAFNQSVEFEYEIIVVNDGGESVDGVYSSITDTYSDLICKLKLVNHPVNLGAAAAFNTGLCYAAGDYICHLADDDELFANHLYELVSRIGCSNIVYSDHLECTQNPDDKRLYACEKRWSVDFNRGMLLMNHNYIPHPCICYERALVKRIGPYRNGLKCLIDWDFLRRAALVYNFEHIPVVTGKYYVNNKDQLSRLIDESRDEWIKNKLDVINYRDIWQNENVVNIYVDARGSEIEYHGVKFIRESISFPVTVNYITDDLTKGLDWAREYGKCHDSIIPYDGPNADFQGFIKRVNDIYGRSRHILILPYERGIMTLSRSIRDIQGWITDNLLGGI